MSIAWAVAAAAAVAVVLVGAALLGGRWLGHTNNQDGDRED